ncbi:MAG: hypothetical protein B7X75_07540, partial [Sphingobacteriales bacterium 39-40-5]
MNIKSVLLVLTALIAPYRAGNAFMSPKKHVQFKQERYYTVEDFKSVKKFDTHIHINTDESTFIKLAQED